MTRTRSQIATAQKEQTVKKNEKTQCDEKKSQKSTSNKTQITLNSKQKSIEAPFKASSKKQVLKDAVPNQSVSSRSLRIQKFQQDKIQDSKKVQPQILKKKCNTKKIESSKIEFSQNQVINQIQDTIPIPIQNLQNQQVMIYQKDISASSFQQKKIITNQQQKSKIQSQANKIKVYKKNNIQNPDFISIDQRQTIYSQKVIALDSQNTEIKINENVLAENTTQINNKHLKNEKNQKIEEQFIIKLDEEMRESDNNNFENQSSSSNYTPKLNNKNQKKRNDQSLKQKKIEQNFDKQNDQKDLDQNNNIQYNNLKPYLNIEKVAFKQKYANDLINWNILKKYDTKVSLDQQYGLQNGGETTLTRTTLNQVIKEALPQEVRAQKDSIDLIYFISNQILDLMADIANNVCYNQKKKNIIPEHLLRALYALNLDEYLPYILFDDQNFHLSELEFREILSIKEKAFNSSLKNKNDQQIGQLDNFSRASDAIKIDEFNQNQSQLREQIIQSILKKMTEAQTGEKKKKKKNMAMIYSKGLTDQQIEEEQRKLFENASLQEDSIAAGDEQFGADNNNGTDYQNMYQVDYYQFQNNNDQANQFSGADQQFQSSYLQNGELVTDQNGMQQNQNMNEGYNEWILYKQNWIVYNKQLLDQEYDIWVQQNVNFNISQKEKLPEENEQQQKQLAEQEIITFKQNYSLEYFQDLQFNEFYNQQAQSAQENICCGQQIQNFDVSQINQNQTIQQIENTVSFAKDNQGQNQQIIDLKNKKQQVLNQINKNEDQKNIDFDYCENDQENDETIQAQNEFIQ